MEDEDDDVHLCIRCRRSFVGLENYISHRKQNCRKKAEFSELEIPPTSNSTDNQRSTCFNEKQDISIRTKCKNLEDLGIEDQSKSRTSLVLRKSDEPVAENAPISKVDSILSSEQVSHSKFLKNESTQIQNDHFTRFYDPLFNNDTSVTSFLKTFDNFSESNKLTNISDSQSLFTSKENAAPFDLESHGFEQRYPDFYGSLAAQSSQDIDQSVASTSTAKFRDTEPNIVSSCGAIKYETQNEQLKALVEITSGSGPSQAQDILKQDDFLSSLELSSVKVIHDKRKYAYDDEEEEEDEEDDHRPPSHYTGGKWRPGMQPPANVAGKWRPFSPTITLDRHESDHDMESDIMCDNVTSSSAKRRTHICTKGKWLPGKEPKQNSRPSTTHNCKPCNAEFSTKASFVRHLSTTIHSNIAMELDGDDNCAVKERPMRKKKQQAQKFLKATIANLKRKKPMSNTSLEDETKPISKSESSIDRFHSLNAKEHNNDTDNDAPEEIKPANKKSALKMKCPICRLSFAKAYLGRHFSSLAHIHNELEHKLTSVTNSQSEQDQIVLDNMEILISSCMFSCEYCKFYCNTPEDFQYHFENHEIKQSADRNLVIKFYCSACPDDDGMDPNEIQHHLLTPAHFVSARDKILSAQRVLVSMKQYFVCNICAQLFRYYRQYEDHRKRSHQHNEFKLSSRSPRLCPICPFKDNSYRRVREHIRATHDIIPHYACFLCGTMHGTSDEARKHRHSREHRLKAGLEKAGSKYCRFCYNEYDSLELLEKHLMQQHQSLCMPCMKCGVIFVMSAAYKAHLKDCSGEVRQANLTYEFSCELCPFSNPLSAHVLTHTTLVHGESKQNCYVCHLCQVFE